MATTKQAKFEVGKTYSNGWNKIEVIDRIDEVKAGRYFDCIVKTLKFRFGNVVESVPIYTSIENHHMDSIEYVEFCGCEWYADNREVQ